MTTKTVMFTLGAGLTLALSSTALEAGSNPFQTERLAQGYENHSSLFQTVADTCDMDKKDDKKDDKKGDGKCSAGKCASGKCSGAPQ